MANAPRTARNSTNSARMILKKLITENLQSESLMRFGRLQRDKRSRARPRSQSFARRLDARLIQHARAPHSSAPARLSPVPARQVVLRHLPQLRPARVAHRVVYEADVRAPARAPAVNLFEFRPPPFGIPQRAEVV